MHIKTEVINNETYHWFEFKIDPSVAYSEMYGIYSYYTSEYRRLTDENLYRPNDCQINITANLFSRALSNLWDDTLEIYKIKSITVSSRNVVSTSLMDSIGMVHIYIKAKEKNTDQLYSEKVLAWIDNLK